MGPQHGESNLLPGSASTAPDHRRVLEWYGDPEAPWFGSRLTTGVIGDSLMAREILTHTCIRELASDFPGGTR